VNARIDAPGALYHIIFRGIERRKIFRDNKDRDNFLDRLGNVLSDSGTPCYAWALIPNQRIEFTFLPTSRRAPPGLGFQTDAKPTDQHAFFKTNGTVLSIYPIDKLAEDISPDLPKEKPIFSGITLAYNVKKKSDVNAVLNRHKTLEAKS